MISNEVIRIIALQYGFKLKGQPSGEDDLNPYVYDFARKLINMAGDQVASATPTPPEGKLVGCHEADDRPIPMILHCPGCGAQHVDAETDEWDNPPHRSHLCHNCGHIWRPADVATTGVESIQTKGKADSPLAVKAADDELRTAAEEFVRWYDSLEPENSIHAITLIHNLRAALNKGKS